jgi:alginate O-acetyltransferase complex protein AlgI
MLFNSFTFWIFFAVVLLLYRVLPHRAQNRMLLVASYVFYGTWDWRFLSLILVSTVVDFFVGKAIAAPAASDSARKRWLILSLCTNLGLLGIFKYLGFFVDSAAALLVALGFEPNLWSLRIILPVGISFYTFQTLSYTIDIYRRQLKPCDDFLDFALYVGFFPQLVAGPIERAKRLLPQIMEARVVTSRDFQLGLYCILLGLFKKVVLADNMALVVDHVFSQPVGSLSAWDCLLGVYAFAFQIYGDFHGYSLIAQGTAFWLGIRLMDNFRHPYFAISPQDFWRRWHISLSTWLRDYLYIPLGGNRGTQVQTYRNLLATMILGGLWHGAAWTFVIWGIIHGGWLAIHRFLSERAPERAEPGWLGLGIRMFFTFQIVCVTWLFFRAESVPQAIGFFASLFGNYAVSEITVTGYALLAFFALPMIAYEVWVERRGELFAITTVHWGWRVALYSVILLFLLWFPAPVPSEFIYFQF